MGSWIGLMAIFALVLALVATHPSVSRADDAPKLEVLRGLQLEREQRELEEAKRRAQDEAVRKQGSHVIPPVFRRDPADEYFTKGEALDRAGYGPEAVQEYVRAARAGSAKAARRLADIYETGLPGIGHDYSESVQWEHVARLLGSRRREEGFRGPLLREAQILEDLGRGAEAIPIYRRAARSGSGLAALRLAKMYDEGIPGVGRDYAQALKWYNAARFLSGLEDLPRKP